MTIFIILTLLVTLIAVWVIALRPYLRKQPWAQGFFDAIEPIERAIYLKSESILWARTLTGLGVLVEALLTLGAIDFTPFLPLVPEQYQSTANAVIHMMPIFVSLLGIIQEKLRRDVTKPLAVVAMPNDAPIDAKIAVAEAEVKTAVATEAAKAVQ